MDVRPFIETVGTAVDAAGVALIALGLIYTTARFVARMRGEGDAAYRRYREGLGRTLLLGLEFLVAADVIRTVAIEPTYENIGVLALIVVIRTFLSWSLEVELDGRWPWQRHGPPRDDAPSGPA
jgi:uncharacterized membrane protein